MRPRVFPAEDSRSPSRSPAWRSSFNEAAGIPRGRLRAPAGAAPTPNASMRPRVFPAEDVPRVRRVVVVLDASMRPRVFPAEDRPRRVSAALVNRASMRPRVFPAEDDGDVEVSFEDLFSLQ